MYTLKGASKKQPHTTRAQKALAQASISGIKNIHWSYGQTLLITVRPIS